MKITPETKWKDLSLEEQKFFNDLSINKQDYLQRLRAVAQGKRCFMCKFEFETVPEIDFHLKSTHGVFLHDIIETSISRSKSQNNI